MLGVQKRTDNVAEDLLGLKPLHYRQEQYNTCVDLGDWGGLFTVGWDRMVKFRDLKGKEMKQLINRQLIYPPPARGSDGVSPDSDPTRHRPLLFSIAYRMVGSVQEAEDLVQEAFLRWAHVDAERVHSPKDFL